MVGALAAGSTEGLALASFQNTTEETLFIRKMRITLNLIDSAPSEFALLQISKQRSLVVADGTSGFNLNTQVSVPSAAAGAEDGSSSVNELLQFAKGEVTLEPNEEIFLNIGKSNGGDAEAVVAVGHHF